MGLFSKKPSACAQSIIDYLGCKCEYFPQSNTDMNLMSAYRKAAEKGRSRGFTPVIIIVDRVLEEWFSDIVHEGRTPQQFREETLSKSSEGGREVIAEMAQLLQEEYGEDGDEIEVGEITGGDTQDCFVSYRDFSGGGISEVILAYIPTDKPYEVFAWVPFGGWNECPDAERMMKISRYWYEQYGVVPAVIGHDTLECSIEKPLDKETAAAAANEIFAVCPDDVWQSELGSIGALADTLTKSAVWYFWWD